MTQPPTAGGDDNAFPCFALAAAALVPGWVSFAARRGHGAADELIAEVMGKEIGERQKITRRLTARFGPLPAWASEKIAAAGIESMEAWGVKRFTAKPLEECLS